MLNAETLFVVYYGSQDVRLHRNVPESAPTVCTIIMLDTYAGRVVTAKRGLLNRSGLTLEGWSTPTWRLSAILGDVRANREHAVEDYIVLNGNRCPIEET